MKISHRFPSLCFLLLLPSAPASFLFMRALFISFPFTMTKPAKATKAATKVGKAMATTRGAWDTSKFRGSDLRRLEKEGFLAAGDARIPGNEATPQPRPDE